MSVNDLSFNSVLPWTSGTQRVADDPRGAVIILRRLSQVALDSQVSGMLLSSVGHHPSVHRKTTSC